MRIQKIVIGLFLLCGIFIFYFITRLNAEGQKVFKEEKAANSYVLDVYQGYKGKPNYRVMLLADSQTFSVPKQILYTIQKGDSVKKVKGNPYFEIKLGKASHFEKIYYP